MDQKFFDVPFAFSGDQTVVPDAVQADGSVSFTNGWGFDYQRDLATDPLAKPVDRSTMNYIIGAITGALSAIQKTGAPEWVTTAQNGGTALAYPKYAIVRYSATIPATTFETYVSVVDNNTSVPGADANWQPVARVVAASTDIVAGTSNRLLVTPLGLKSYPGNAAQTFNVNTAAAANHAVPLSQTQTLISASAPLAGAISNLDAYLDTAGTSVTFTASEVILADALGGNKQVISNLNSLLNVSTTGAGGMDTGLAPASGTIAVYGIYNPTTSTKNVLAQAITAAPSQIYTGSSMPAGYTRSGLISILNTNPSRQILPFKQVNRKISIGPVGIYGTSTDGGARWNVQSFSGACPPGSRSATGYANASCSATGSVTINTGVACDGNGVGNQTSNQVFPSGGGTSLQFTDIPLTNAQALFLFYHVQSGTPSSLSWQFFATAYTI